MRTRTAPIQVIGWLLAAVACAPPAAIEVAPRAAPALSRVETVFVDRAVIETETGEPGSGSDARAAIERELRGVKRLKLADSRDQADAYLVYEQADRLACVACEQPEDLWHWWGFVFDSRGRELVSLHGEMTRNGHSPPRRFVAELEGVLKRSRRSAARAPTVENSR